ncbi:MAG: D-alanyl-D-alanine carboxypeptidase family protein [Ruminococcus sp.]|nr:D-alanyl-D-alanine carboxypeptidase family protein [Ruminococcus sp.]
MTRKEKKKNRRINNGKRYRIRYDRIVILVLVLIVLAVVITSCVKAFFGKEESDTPESSQSLSSEKSDSTETSDTGESNKTTESSVSSDTSVTGEITTEASTSSVTTITTTTKAIPTGYKREKHSYEDIYKVDLVLVNAEYDYKFYEDDINTITLFDNKSDSYGAGDFVTRLDRNVLNHLNEMIDAYAESQYLDSTYIFILDGYRTYDEQVERHSSGKSRTFEAGHTDYHTGRTFDIYCSDTFSNIGYAYFNPTDNYEWFVENSGNYGFITRFPEYKSEITGENARTYTYRYVGVPHAVYINSNNLCMEEYIELIKAYTIENQLEITVDGRTYGVYYVPAEEDETDVLVPLGKMYTVSGNNVDGFIVTVNEGYKTTINN